MAGLKIFIDAKNNTGGVFSKIEGDLTKLGNKAKGAGGVGGMGGVKGGGFLGNLGQAKDRFMAGDMGGAIAGVTKAIGLMGAAVIGAAAAFKFIGSTSKEYADKIKDIGNTTGFSTGAIQALGDSASKNGMDINTLRSNLERLSGVQNAIGTDKKAQEAFEALGISAEQVARLKPEDLLQRIANGLKTTGNVSSLKDIFGQRGFAQMMPILRELADYNYDGLISGKIVDKSAIAAINKLSDNWQDVKNQFTRGITNLGGGIAKLYLGKDEVKRITEEKIKQEKIAEEAARISREAQVEQLRNEEKITDLKKESKKIQESLQKDAGAIAEEDKKANRELGNFKDIKEGLGRKATDNIFDFRGDQSGAQVRDELVARAMSRGADRDIRRKEKADERANARLVKLAQSDAVRIAGGGRETKRAAAARAALQKQQDLLDVQKNIAKRERDLKILQEKRDLVQEQIADNTKVLKEAIQMKGGE